MSSAITSAPAFDFDAFAYAGSRSVIEVDGFRIKAVIHRDDDTGAPWEEHDGHGIVSEWTSREKAPGELVLCESGGRKRFYDFAGTMEIAKRDGWGTPVPYRTAGQARAAAVRADFKWLKAWCDDEWFLCGVALSVSRAGVDLTGPYGAAIWATECGGPGFTGAHLNELAADLIGEALDAARETLVRLAE